MLTNRQERQRHNHRIQIRVSHFLFSKFVKKSKKHENLPILIQLLQLCSIIIIVPSFIFIFIFNIAAITCITYLCFVMPYSHGFEFDFLIIDGYVVTIL